MKNIKKKIKGIALVSLLCVVVTAITGCFSLQELKDKQAYFDEEGNICVGNYKYIAIGDAEDLYPDFYNCDLVYFSDNEIPLLLTPEMCPSYTRSGDGIFLDGDKGYYCREDKYEEVVSALSKGHVAKGYKYTYFDYEEGTNKERILTDEEKEAIDEIFSTVKKKQFNEYYCLANVFSYPDADMTYLTRDEFDVVKKGKNIYLLKYDEEKDQEWFYKVPDNKKHIFDDVIKAGDEIYTKYEELG